MKKSESPYDPFPWRKKEGRQKNGVEAVLNWRVLQARLENFIYPLHVGRFTEQTDN